MREGAGRRKQKERRSFPRSFLVIFTTRSEAKLTIFGRFLSEGCSFLRWGAAKAKGTKCRSGWQSAHSATPAQVARRPSRGQPLFVFVRTHE